MKKITRTTLCLLLLALGGVSVLSLCGNDYHRRDATRILTVKECLECHNGIIGTAIHICIGRQCLLTRTHSVYSVYPPAGKQRFYASKEEITKAGCILENGTITCLSCHDLTKPPPHVIRQGDDLCRLCHLGR